jgi:hypothetical protein
MPGLNYRETAQRLGLNTCMVLDVLSVQIAAMASIDAYAPPLNPPSAKTVGAWRRAAARNPIS